MTKEKMMEIVLDLNLRWSRYGDLEGHEENYTLIPKIKKLYYKKKKIEQELQLELINLRNKLLTEAYYDRNKKR
jgi:hypothetical protein